MDPVTRHVDLYSVQGERNEFVHTKTLGAWAANLIHFGRFTNNNLDSPSPEWVLGMGWQGSPYVEWTWGDRWRHHMARGRGWFGVSPAGETGEFHVEGWHEMVVIAIPTDAVKHYFGERPFNLDLGVLHDRYHRDGQVLSLTKMLLKAEEHEHLWTEAILAHLVERLVILAEQRVSQEKHLELSSQQIRLLNDYIESNIVRGVLATDLSAIAGYSPRRLQDLWIATFGKTIHQDIVDRRLDISIQKLRSGLSGDQAASESGFYDAPHLARTLKKCRNLRISDLQR